MLNKKKSSFKEFMKGNGFYILTGVALMAIVVTAMIIPKKGEGNVAQQPERYADNRPATTKDINDLRVPTIDPRMEEDELTSDKEKEEEDSPSQEAKETASVEKVEDEIVQDGKEDLVSETFSSTTSAGTEIFHADNDFFAWPLQNKIIYPYSDNDIGRSVMNPTLDRTMRTFGLFIEAKENDNVQSAARGKVLSIVDYPVEDLDYPQVGTAVIIDHGNDWKTVYGLHEGSTQVKVGDLVETGDIIGSIGKASKDFSLTGANLYFQVLKNDMPVNPEQKLEN